MTDYKNLKLIATSSPHIRAAENTKSIMLDVIIAMVPALAFACYWFGPRALTLTCVSVIACMFWEWLYRKALKKPQSVGDLSAVVTGMLLAFVSPVTLEYWKIIIGAFFSIVVVKHAGFLGRLHDLLGGFHRRRQGSHLRHLCGCGHFRNASGTDEGRRHRRYLRRHEREVLRNGYVPG